MLIHIGLQYKSKEYAETFFNKILGIPMQRTFTMSCKLGKSIFGIEEEVGVVVFGNDNVVFEIFIGDAYKRFSYEHICLEVPDKEEFILCLKQNTFCCPGPFSRDGQNEF